MSLMFQGNHGLTAVYNRFHDRGDKSPDIVRLRELHDAMDRAVLDAYGWTDIRPTCEFLLDYEDEDEEDEDSLTPGPSPTSGRGGRGRRKPWRYRWPDEIRDEVLARLLKLNAERAAEERRAGAAAAAAGKTKKTTSRRRASRKPTSDQSPELFE